MDSYTSNDLNELSMTGIGSLLGATEEDINSLEVRVSSNESNITTLQADLATEVNNRTNADTVLHQNIEAEAEARVDGDALKVNKSGDTMTGTLNISGGNVGLNITSTTAGNSHIGGTQTATYLSSQVGTRIRNYIIGTGGYSYIADFLTTGIALNKNTTITGALSVADDVQANEFIITNSTTGNTTRLGYQTFGGTYGVFIGHRAGALNEGINNTAVGYESMYSSSGATQSTCLGRMSGYHNRGVYNHFIGMNAGYGFSTEKITGGNNIGFGVFSLSYLTTGANNVCVGNNSGFYTTTGIQNTAIGHNAMRGLNSSYLTTGSYNVAVGYASLYYLSSGVNNTAVGYESMNGINDSATLITGYQNTAVGRRSLFRLTSGDSNVAVGFQSLGDETGGVSGDNNVCVGYRSGYKIKSGANNLCLGHGSGENNTGSNNVFIGAYSGSNTSSVNHRLGIGYDAEPTQEKEILITAGSSNKNQIQMLTNAMSWIFGGTTKMLMEIVSSVATFNFYGNVDITEDLSVDGNAIIGGELTVSGSNEIYYKNQTLDARFHSLANNYYTETESESLFVNVDGDTMTGDLTVDGSVEGGVSRMATRTYNSIDYASFSHNANTSSSNYAVLQGSNGYTFLNSTSTLDFRINHAQVGTWDTTRLRCLNKLEVVGNLEVSGGSATNILRTTWNTGVSQFEVEYPTGTGLFFNNALSTPSLRLLDTKVQVYNGLEVVNGNLEVSGDTTMTGDLEVSGDTTMTGDLSVDGTATFNDDVVIRDNILSIYKDGDNKQAYLYISVDGDNDMVLDAYTASGDMGITFRTGAGDDRMRITKAGDITMENKLTVGGNLDIGDSSVSNTTQDVSASGQLKMFVNGNITRETGTDAEIKAQFDAREHHIYRQADYDYINFSSGGAIGTTHRITFGYTDELYIPYANETNKAPTNHAIKFEVSTKTSSTPNEVMRLESDNVVISKDTEITGDLGVGGDTTMTGNLDVGGDTTMTGNLDVVGNATIGGIAEVVGDLSTDSDLIVAGDIRKSSYPLITHTHNFYQSTSFLSSQWLLWTSVRDGVTDGVRGMKFPYAIKPYAVSISAEEDGLVGSVNLTIKVFKYPNNNNNSNIQSVAGGILCGLRNYDITDNCAFCNDLDEPLTIEANTTWGVYLQKSGNGSADDNPEIIVMIHCYQV
jgi:hypothetical protein